LFLNSARGTAAVKFERIQMLARSERIQNSNCGKEERRAAEFLLSRNFPFLPAAAAELLLKIGVFHFRPKGPRLGLGFLRLV
jgi:hypothetical protein